MSTYHIGDIIDGEVTGIQPYGIFVKLSKNKQGLIHISELNHGFVSDISNLYQLGETVKVQIIDIDEYTQKMSLSVRSLKPLNTPHHPKRMGRPAKRRTPDIGFQAIADEMPTWIDEGLKNVKKFKSKEKINELY